MDLSSWLRGAGPLVELSRNFRETRDLRQLLERHGIGAPSTTMVLRHIRGQKSSGSPGEFVVWRRLSGRGLELGVAMMTKAR